MPYKILFSNIGYAKGIDGSLEQHIRLFSRHFYTTLSVQQQVLAQLKEILIQEDPDICCFVEVDKGSFHSARYNQLNALIDERYPYHDITGKYGEESWLSRALFHVGKSNAFLSKSKIPFQKKYFENGTKRLIYNLELPDNIDLYFAHFSLDWKVRRKQMKEINALITASSKYVIIMADFNIFQGFSELFPLLEGTDLEVLSKEDEPTFTFHKRKLTLDLCICSKALRERASLRIINQPFSDHAALVLEI